LACKAIVISEQDNVATLISGGEEGHQPSLTGAVSEGAVTLVSDVPPGHKVAISPIAKGEQITKYGHAIGTATADIRTGEHVHVHNMESNRGRGDLGSAAE
jgi:altronate dehydratase small subunit